MKGGATCRVTVLAGFLGAGKTTLLRSALAPGAPGVAVIVNEFGEAGLDHELVVGAPEGRLLVSGGCACCSRREDLVGALRQLLDGHERSPAGTLRRVVIETSGLADPAPIVFTIATDPVLRHHFAVDSIVTVVDGVAGLEQLARHPEARKQVEVADRLVVTKTDIADAGSFRALRHRLRELNPVAQVARMPSAKPWRLLSWEGEGPPPALRATSPSESGRTASPSETSHSARVTCLSLDLDEPVDWVAFGVWLTLLLHTHGEALLRVKGILEAADLGAVAINAVQHVMYPPEHLGAAAGRRRARLVVIAQGVEPEPIARSLWAFQRAA